MACGNGMSELDKVVEFLQRVSPSELSEELVSYKRKILNLEYEISTVHKRNIVKLQANLDDALRQIRQFEQQGSRRTPISTSKYVGRVKTEFGPMWKNLQHHENSCYISTFIQLLILIPEIMNFSSHMLIPRNNAVRRVVYEVQQVYKMMKTSVNRVIDPVGVLGAIIAMNNPRFKACEFGSALGLFEHIFKHFRKITQNIFTLHQFAELRESIPVPNHIFNIDIPTSSLSILLNRFKNISSYPTYLFMSIRITKTLQLARSFVGDSIITSPAFPGSMVYKLKAIILTEAGSRHTIMYRQKDNQRGRPRSLWYIFDDSARDNLIKSITFDTLIETLNQEGNEVNILYHHPSQSTTNVRYYTSMLAPTDLPTNAQARDVLLKRFCRGIYQRECSRSAMPDDDTLVKTVAAMVRGRRVRVDVVARELFVDQVAPTQ